MHSDSRLKRLLYRLGLLIPDRIFLMLKFRKNFGRWPDLRNPRTFNEKLNWLKLHDHNPLYTRMVDKYDAKEYVASIIGPQYIIPTYGVWDRAEDIDFDSLPEKFVLKATHDSGRVIICKDKSKLDIDLAIKEMDESLRRNFYAVTREWPYKNVKPRIIAEQLLESPADEDLADYKVHNFNGVAQDINDYKFFCFNGKVKFMKVDIDRSVSHRANYYDRNFNLLDIEEVIYPRDVTRYIERPAKFDAMIMLAEKLAYCFRFLRVDFYNIDNHIYFGELTFYPGSGMEKMNPPDVDEKIGAMIKLR